MFLSKIGTSGNVTETRVEFEQIAKDLIMVSIDTDINDQTEVFSYWRLMGNGGNPPLEVGINPIIGTIKRIVFFMDVDCVEQFQFEETYAAKGNVLVDVGIFMRQNDYVDIEGSYFVTLINEKLVCKFCKEFNAAEAILNGDIEIYMNNNGQIIGFAINSLPESSLRMIESLV